MSDQKFSQANIADILKKIENGALISDLCREYDISSTTLYEWQTRYGHTDDLVKRLKQLEEENYMLKGALADIQIQRKAMKTGDTDHIYRIMAANIPGTAITILDRAERYLLAEGDFLATMGYVKENMPGKKISEVITPENYKYYKGIIDRAFSGETILTTRQTISGYYSLMKVVPLKDSKDEIFAIMFVLIDVTALTEVQQELIELNKELEEKVLERTGQLESFSYTVSHDLRAPLRVISGFSRIVKDEFSSRLEDPEFDEIVDTIIRNALRMDLLITDLLNFSKFKSKDLSKAPMDMNNLVREVMHGLTLMEANRKFEIAIGDLEPAQGDISLMRQVWQNLLSNAVKYTGKKEVAVIEVSCSRTDGSICYSVIDNGAGFDMLYADKLFGVFQRMHKVSEFEGTGVGLALVKNIIERHGGKIWAESEVSKGAKFYFTLPIFK